MAEHTEPSSPAVAKKGIGKGPIIGGVVVVAAMAVGGGVALRNAKAHTQAADAQAAGADKPPGEGGAAEGAAVEGAAKAEAEPVGEGGEEESSLVTMSPFVVNLDDDTGEMHYLKCTVAVQLSAPSHAKAFEASTPKTRNAVLFYLSSLKVGDTQGLDNKKKILERVRTEVRDSAGKGAVADVYLTEFVIQ
jgi:flagellar basal body-associated protein FliL